MCPGIRLASSSASSGVPPPGSRVRPPCRSAILPQRARRTGAEGRREGTRLSLEGFRRRCLCLERHGVADGGHLPARKFRGARVERVRQRLPWHHGVVQLAAQSLGGAAQACQVIVSSASERSSRMTVEGVTPSRPASCVAAMPKGPYAEIALIRREDGRSSSFCRA